MSVAKIRTRERDAILLSLRSGISPKIGIEHIQVGRKYEIESLVEDIERIAKGGSAFRLIIGDYGSGKTFLMGVVRAIALKKEVVVMQSDLSMDRRLYSRIGLSRNLYTELINSLSTRTKPEGGALTSIVERFITLCEEESVELKVNVQNIIMRRLSPLKEMTLGYQFLQIILQYCQGHHDNSDELKETALQWLRAGFQNKRDARNATGVTEIINDFNFYDALKLIGKFCVIAGYKGLLINLDELVSVQRIRESTSRRYNYEQLLRCLNECAQGEAASFGLIFNGTNELLLCEDRGLYSYKALKSRLMPNMFAKASAVNDTRSTVLLLKSLLPEELMVLLKNIRHVYAMGDESKYLMPNDGLVSFLLRCHKVIGPTFVEAPRTAIKAFVDLLSVLDQNPDLSWKATLEQMEIPEGEFIDD